MGNGCSNYGEKCPALPNPWVRLYWGWSNVIEINQDNTSYTLYPANMHTNIAAKTVYKISTNTPGEYFLLENRQNIGFDKWVGYYSIPFHGLIVWHVHKDIDRTQDNNTGAIQRLYPLQASNNNDVRNGTIDNWHPELPFPGATNNHFLSGTTTPALKTWNNQYLNKAICSIREVPYTYNNQNTNLIEFVYNQEIIGNDVICDSEIYHLDNSLSNCNYTWSYEGYDPYAAPYPLYIDEGQGTNVATYRRGFSLAPDLDPDGPIGPMFIHSFPINIPFVGEKTITAKLSYGNNRE